MKILSCSHVLPSKKVTNDELLDEITWANRARFSRRQREALRESLAAAFHRSGTKFRYHRARHETAANLTARAGRQALETSGLGPLDVDLLIFAGVGRGCLEPASANIFQDILGLTKATAFDVLDACASWIRSMAIARSFITQNTYKTVLVINSEFNFREYANFEFERIEDIKFYYPAFTIGEATTATLLTGDHNDDNFYFSFRNWGHQHDLCMIPLPNIRQYTKPKVDNGYTSLRFYADADKLVRFTMKKLMAHYREDPALNGGQYDIVYGHAASEATCTYWMKHAGISQKKLYRTHGEYGNTVSASIPLAISLSAEEKALARGMKALAVVGSAGVVTAYCSFEY
jgi:3-oxoacyl-[acyl-carrier-protein] synthase III